MKIFYTDHFVLPLPPGHRFPISKYAMLCQRVEAAALSGGEPLPIPDAASDEQILHAHYPGYLRGVVNGRLAAAETRQIRFP